MSHPVRPLRLAAYAASLLLATFLLCYVPLQAGVAIAVRFWIQAEINANRSRTAATIPTLQRSIAAYSQPNFNGIDEEQRKARLQHLREYLAETQLMLSKPEQINLSYPQAVLESVFNPLGGVSIGTTSHPAYGIRPYNPPRSHWPIVLKQHVGKSGAGGAVLADVVMPAMKFLAFGYALTFMMPVSFVFLPVTRRRAHVLGRHVARVSAYSLAWPVGATVVCSLAFTLGLLNHNLTMTSAILIGGVSALMVPLMLFLWWAIAIKMYLKIPRSIFTTCVLLLLCTLTILAASFVSMPTLLFPKPW